MNRGCFSIYFSHLYFNNVLQVSEYKFYIASIKFNSKCFALFDTILDVIIFLMSFSHFSLQGYRNAINFCILTLYSTTCTLLALLYFFMDSFGFSKFKIMLSPNRNSFTSSFSMWIPFILFSCLIALTRTSSKILDKVMTSLSYS